MAVGTEKQPGTPPAGGPLEKAEADNASTKGPVSGDNTDTERGATKETTSEPVRTVTGIRWIIVVFAILSSTFLFALDNTVVADVQPQIVLQFDAITDIAWLAVAFIMAATSTNLLFGQLYSHLKPKWLYIGSVVVFEVGSAVCGAAPTMNALIVGRALCGLGGVGMYLGVMTLIAATTTIQERPAYLASIGLTWGLGTVLGPVVGGAFADSGATWRWAFYINLPIGGLAAPVYLWMLPSPDPQPGASLWQRLREIDWVGAPLMLGAIICFTMGISFGGVMYDWNSGQEIALFVVAGVLFIVFGLQQAYCIGTTKERRLFPVELIVSRKYYRTIILMFCITASGGCAIFVPVYFIPVFFQFTRGDSAIDAAVRLLPFIILAVFVTLLQGGVLSHPSGGLYFPWFTVGGAIVVAASSLMYVVEPSTSTAWVYGASAMLGAGVGTFTQAGFSIAQASVPEEMAAVASSMMALAQTSGINIALAVGNAVFLNRAEKRLTEILPDTVPEEQIQLAIAGVGGDFVQTLPPDMQAEILDAIVEALNLPYILVIVAGAVVLVSSLLCKRERLFMKPAGGGA
ncbi:Efflux pump [Colletotrichum fructicola]|uniref:Efflux pump patC n=1 Tax=Colletotrichum fructicola (strain Nara gc5) TaxID=1213859 RepID=L2FLH6_COLFN|nr:Efflux pump [Colletotrichum fructicola]KAE9574261.1 Efflux pump [Colletotrichum fructicola]KAF4431692.1 Efflux pump patC [Colletotrichum fructicola]KAF4474178.1 Efflux pump patC [Colletotrichum fructicola Nara gc5]KAF4884837.1 Efflux pump patC [Colletotrichum fructicola]